MSNRSKKFVFIPFCLIAQAYQAQGIVKYEWKSSIKPIVKLLIDNDINIIQMPCAETSFKDSLIREPMGISKYNTKEFNEHCEVLAEEVSKQIHMICKNGYEVIAILGIEQSPSCCVNYIYTNFFISSKALASWSGQEVALSPHKIPFNLFIASSIFIP